MVNQYWNTHGFTLAFVSIICGILFSTVFLLILVRISPSGSATAAGKLWVFICGISAVLIDIGLLNYDSKKHSAKVIFPKIKKYFEDW